MAEPSLDELQMRMPDGGSVYVETPPNMYQFTGLVAEPWNTASALLFVVIPIIWLFVLRGRFRQHPFLTICLPILFTGGIGGMLFHGLRRHRAFLMMDLIPIYLLGLSVAIWMWVRLGPKLVHLIGVLGFLGLLKLLSTFTLPKQWAINGSYAALATLVMLPVAVTMVRTRFRFAGWIYTALACFGLAWICRIADTVRPPLLPMGTHWLWHTFGALTTAAVSMYIYRIEGLAVRPARAEEAPAS